MATKLYVGNLPFSATKDQLVELFSQFGEVTDSVVISDRATGRSRGFGFVELASEEAAKEAVAKMDGFEMDGRQLKVNEARPKSDNQGFRPRQ